MKPLDRHHIQLASKYWRAECATYRISSCGIRIRKRDAAYLICRRKAHKNGICPMLLRFQCACPDQVDIRFSPKVDAAENFVRLWGKPIIDRNWICQIGETSRTGTPFLLAPHIRCPSGMGAAAAQKRQAN